VFLVFIPIFRFKINGLMETAAFLNQPLYTLGLSEQFCEKCGNMGFKTIAEILLVSPEAMLKMEGFSYHWLAELSEVLHKEGLLHLLQPLPGSIPG
jgi:hypothetical protein